MKNVSNSKDKLNKQIPLLEVNNLSLSFPIYEKGFEETEIKVIKNFEISVEEGQILAIVGASGAGKSLLADAIFDILPNHAQLKGEIKYKGKELSKKKLQSLRGREFILIPQSIKALNPLIRVGKQVEHVMPQMPESDRAKKLQQIFEKLDLDYTVAKKFPHELSGGMARRILIAIAMASPAKLIVADEPTPGLDEYARAETLKHLKEMTKEGRGIIFITHDIHAALEIAQKIAIFYNGRTIDLADIEDFSGEGEKLKHPYTKALWNALPENGFTAPAKIDVSNFTKCF